MEDATNLLYYSTVLYDRRPILLLCTSLLGMVRFVVQD